MITPIATVVFAAAMALSLSVEAESFFHPDTPSATPDEDDDQAPRELAADGSTAPSLDPPPTP